jgi:hypothetical protein
MDPEDTDCVLHIAPTDLENAARRLMNANTKHTLRSLRIAAWGANRFGTQWFSINEASEVDSKGLRKYLFSRKVAGELNVMKIAETRKVRDRGREIYQARITCELYPSAHHHGKSSASLMRMVNRYSGKHTGATPAILLLLIASNIHRITWSTELGKYLAPQLDINSLPSHPTRLIKIMDREGILRIERCHTHQSKAFLVYPIAD